MLTIAAAIVLAWIIIVNWEIAVVIVMYLAIGAFILAVGFGIILLAVGLSGLL